MADVVHDEGDAGDGGGGGPSLVVASVDKMQNYLKRVVPVLIEPEPDLADADTTAGGVGGGAEALAAALNQSVDTVRKFMSEPQASNLVFESQKLSAQQSLSMSLVLHSISFSRSSTHMESAKFLNDWIFSAGACPASCQTQLKR